MAGGPGSYVLGAEEKKELMDVIDSGYLFRYGTPGVDGFQAKVATFEKEMAERLGHKHVVATSSGTGSLLCCLAALGIGMGDEVIVPGYTFIASISTIILMNAVPVLAEIDESLTIDPSKIEQLITPKTKAIVPVHMLGNPCDMDPIMEIARRHNLYVIEDCCQAVGASYKGRRVGTIGDMGAYSLNVFKTITTGDGGFVGCSDDLLYERAFGFHDQGHKPSRMGVEVGNRSMVGMNMRMNELSGAVAVAQGRKLDGILETLRAKKKLLKDQLQGIEGLGFRTVTDPGECGTLLTLRSRRHRAHRPLRLACLQQHGADPRQKDLDRKASLPAVRPDLRQAHAARNGRHSGACGQHLRRRRGQGSRLRHRHQHQFL